MIISHKYKFIWFLHNGHTASTSLLMSLQELHDDLDTYVSPQRLDHGHGSNPEQKISVGNPQAKWVFDSQHTTPEELLDKGFCPKKFDEYTKIVVCRNPYTWMGSMMRKNINVVHFSENTIRRFFASGWMTHRHLSGQASLLKNIDKVIRIENLVEEFEKFKKDFAIEENILLRRFVKNHERIKVDYMKNYTSDGIEFMNKKFAQDFDHLGYEMLSFEKKRKVIGEK